jgi:hypothetical protein
MSAKNTIKATSGNVLFIILLGVFLFGALTFSVTKTTKNDTNGTLSEDQAAIAAAEVLQYANAIKEGIQRMQLLHDVKDHEIDVATNVDEFVVGAANNTCTSTKCQLFHPEGGAIKPRLIPTNFYSPDSNVIVNNLQSQLNEISFYSVEIEGNGENGRNELIMTIIGLHPDICDHINFKMAGISGAPDNDVYGDWDHYTGTLTSFPDGSGEINPAMYENKKTFCIGHSNQQRIFIHVLLER